MRKYRKKEHIENYLKVSYEGDTLFDDVFLYHNSLPELDFEELDTKIKFLGKTISYPIMINAITGGNDFSNTINADLAKIAKHFNIPMAVGSQTILFEDDDEETLMSFRTVREIMGDEGVVIGNINPFTPVEIAVKAIELIKADALQIHVNPAQELVMEEGDRNFKGVVENIEKIVKAIDIPIIVKEVGFGMSEDVVERLYSVGVSYVDISGHGGTNFIEIEDLRNPNIEVNELYSWGIPTALSIIEAVKTERDGLTIIASGGIKTSVDLIKAIVLGADLGAMSGELLNFIMHGGYSSGRYFMEQFLYKFKMTMLLMGCKNVEELKSARYKLAGRLKELV